jgi:hypothetical protein
MPRSRPGKIPLSGGCPRRIGGRAGAPSLDKWVDGRWPRSGLSDLGSAMPYRCAPPLCLLPQTKYSSHSAKGAKSYQPRPPAWVKACAKTQRAESPTHRVFQSHQAHPTPRQRTESPIRRKAFRRRPAQRAPFRQARYQAFNVFTNAKHVEKLKYMHRNPVKRGLAAKPEDWQWSSFRHYSTGVTGVVEIESWWSAMRRERGTAET